MTDDLAKFTQDVRAMVAEGDRVPEQREPSDVAPFDEWSILTRFDDEGRSADLRGHVYFEDRIPPATWLRYVEAIADGLRAAGFDAEVRIVREQV